MAELGLALAGFAGVGSAFGGRKREYGDIDLIRLKVLFLSAGSVIAGSLAVITLASYGFAETTVFEITSWGLAVIMAPTGTRLLLAAYRTVQDPDIVAPFWIVSIGVIYLISIEILFTFNALIGHDPSPLLAAFSVSLVFGLWMFTRLMVRHDR